MTVVVTTADWGEEYLSHQYYTSGTAIIYVIFQSGKELLIKVWLKTFDISPIYVINAETSSVLYENNDSYVKQS